MQPAAAMGSLITARLCLHSPGSSLKKFSIAIVRSIRSCPLPDPLRVPVEGNSVKIPSEFPQEIKVFFTVVKWGVGQGTSGNFFPDSAPRKEKIRDPVMDLDVASAGKEGCNAA